MPHKEILNKNGKKIPSVTQIIKNVGWNTEHLMDFVKYETELGIDHKEYTNKTAKKGSILHDFMEAYMNGQEPKLSEDYDCFLVQESLEIFEKLLKENTIPSMKDFVTISQEQTLISENEEYQGTYDLLAKKGEETWLIDYKSNKWKKEYALQIGAYNQLLLENGIGVDKYGVFLFSTGELIQIPRRTIVAGFEAFKYALGLEKIKSKVRL